MWLWWTDGLRTTELNNTVGRFWTLEAPESWSSASCSHYHWVTDGDAFHWLPCWRHFWSALWALGSSGCWRKRCLQVASARPYEADPGAEGQPLSGFLLQSIKINHCVNISMFSTFQKSGEETTNTCLFLVEPEEIIFNSVKLIVNSQTLSIPILWHLKCTLIYKL